MDKSEYVSIAQFAKAHNVPKQAVLNAIELKALKPYEGIQVDNEPVIPAQVDYKFDLIGVYEYAERKGISYGAVYKRLINPKNPMLYSVEEVTDLMKIDWELYKDAKFRQFVFKHRGRKAS